MRHRVPITTVLFVVLMMCTCANRQLLGPCYEAAQCRKQAETATGTERATLEGKAVGLEAECLKQGEVIKRHQADDVRYRR
jgi:hypothetical protein